MLMRRENGRACACVAHGSVSWLKPHSTCLIAQGSREELCSDVLQRIDGFVPQADSQLPACRSLGPRALSLGASTARSASGSSTRHVSWAKTAERLARALARARGARHKAVEAAPVHMRSRQRRRPGAGSRGRGVRCEAAMMTTTTTTTRRALYCLPWPLSLLHPWRRRRLPRQQGRPLGRDVCGGPCHALPDLTVQIDEEETDGQRKRELCVSFGGVPATNANAPAVLSALPSAHPARATG